MPPKKDDKEEESPSSTPDRLSPVPRDERQNVQRDVADVQRMSMDNAAFYATLRNNYPGESVETEEAINFFEHFTRNWEEMGMTLARGGYLAEGTRIQDIDPVTREQFGRLAATSMHTLATFATVVQGLALGLIRHAQAQQAARGSTGEGSAGPSGSSGEAEGSAEPSGSSREAGQSPGPPESKRPRETEDSSGDSAS